jgi:protein SCO1/2
MSKKERLSILIFCAIFLTTLIPVHGRAQNNHSTHKMSMGKKRTRALVKYNVPDVILINQDGEKVPLKTFLDSDKLVVLDFIFTTCPTICPILSAGMSSLHDRLGPEAKNIQMVSFTIDPEYDTPEIFKEYSQRFGAQEGWEFLTGSREDIDKVMRAFNAYVSDKMNHAPLTFLHAPGETMWVRVNGLMSSAELVAEYRTLIKK